MDKNILLSQMLVPKNGIVQFEAQEPLGTMTLADVGEGVMVSFYSAKPQSCPYCSTELSEEKCLQCGAMARVN